MKTSSTGLLLIKHFEGLRLKAYICPAGRLTIGYGHTGQNISPGQVITEAQADAILNHDLCRFEAGITDAVKVPLNQHQFNALVAFAFNIGLGAFRASTMCDLLNGGHYDAAALEFARWNKVGHDLSAGLVARRAAEAHLFATGELAF